MINVRRAILISWFILLTGVCLSVAQQPTGQESPQQPTYAPRKKEAKGPRAIALMEWTAKGPELIPIAIRIDKDFYDAGIYMAQPIPMALENGVVYEVRKAGEPLGDFTLELAQQQPNGAWVGVGKFESREEEARRKQELAKAAAAAAAPPPEEKDERPVLRRSSPSTGKAAQSQPAAPPSVPSATTSPANAQPAPAAPLHETVGDPNRPILRRGKPHEEQAASLTDKTPAKKPVPLPHGLSTYQVAVSDASPEDPHPYKWNWAKPEEEQEMRSQAEKLALATVAQFASSTSGPRPGRLEDVSIHAYDLNYSNSPDIILSARVLPETIKSPVRRGAKAAQTTAAAPAPGIEYYVTVVGREDIYGQLQKSFAVATDNRHLDAFPRMQLIDAVDADGDGTGDLLFRSTSDTGSSFVIYREMGYRLDELIRVPAPGS